MVVHDIQPIPGVYPGVDRLPRIIPIGELIRHQGCVYTAIRHEDGKTVLDRELEMSHQHTYQPKE